MNVASSVTTARFNALLVEGDKGLGLEGALREHGCAVRCVSSRAAAEEALEGVDLVVIQGISEEDTLALVGKSALLTTTVVASDNAALALKAAKLGATTISGQAIELATAQLGPVLGIVDLKKKVVRGSTNGVSSMPPNSGVVSRRSTPLPKEATPDALTALIEAAEGLVPMHRFQRVYVDYALRRFGGNKVHTAAALGIDRRTIQRWARARAEGVRETPSNAVNTSS